MHNNPGMWAMVAMLAVAAWAWTPSPAFPFLKKSSIRRGRRTREAHALDRAVMFDLTRAALAGGSAVPQALEAVGIACGGAARQQLTRVAAILRMGGQWDEAWLEAPAFAYLSDALEPSWCEGAPPEALLERTAQSIRARRQRVAREAAIRLGEQLIFPLGLCFLPAFVIIGVIPVVVSVGTSI